MRKPIVIHAVPEKSDDPYEFALAILRSGHQDYEAFRLVAEHITENINDNKLDKNALVWVSEALNNILQGMSPTQALGMSRQRGRSKGNYILKSKIAAFVLLRMKEGISKNQAIDLASEKYHRDRRQIQRLLKEISFTDDTDLATLSTIAEVGLDVRMLGDNDN
ncbi:MAG: hypothetical protein AB2689_25310 [Candidatus Thiodiazotropha taylori]